MPKEIAAINLGDGTKLNDNDYEINGRIYHVKHDDPSSGYPLSGPEIHSLNNAEAHLLRIYNSPMDDATKLLVIARSLRKASSGRNPTVVRTALVKAIFDGIE